MNEENIEVNNDWDFLEKISINKRAIIESKNSLTNEEINQINNGSAFYKYLKDGLSKSCIAKSELSLILYYMHYGFLVNLSEIEGIEKISSSNDLKVLHEISKITTQITTKIINKENIVTGVNILMGILKNYDLLIIDHEKKTRTPKADYILILSIFQDYLILKELQNQLKSLDPKILNDIKNFFRSVKALLFNTLSFIGNPESEIEFKEARVYIGKNRTFNFILNEEIYNALKKDFETINNFSILFFNSSPQKEPIEKLLNLIDQFNVERQLDEVFIELPTVFNKDVKLSLTKKKLFLHDVFRMFKHPIAFTKEEEENYEDRTSYLYSLEKEKVRRVDRLVKFRKKNGQNKTKAKKIVSKLT